MIKIGKATPVLMMSPLKNSMKKVSPGDRWSMTNKLLIKSVKIKEAAPNKLHTIATGSSHTGCCTILLNCLLGFPIIPNKLGLFVSVSTFHLHVKRKCEHTHTSTLLFIPQRFNWIKLRGFACR